MSIKVHHQADLILVQAQDEWPTCPANVRALNSTRQKGYSTKPYHGIGEHDGLNLRVYTKDNPQHIQQNIQKFERLLPSNLPYFQQVHGNQIVLAENITPNTQADACYTTLPNQVCSIMTADCLPILLASQDGKVVSAVHAGWKGLALGVVQASLQKMRIQTKEEITAWLGPAIGPQAFEVGSDVIAAFMPSLQRAVQASSLAYVLNRCFTQIHSDKKQDKYFANLYELARIILAHQGVHAVYGGHYCTYTQADYFYSYRRDKETGRMASVIWLE